MQVWERETGKCAVCALGEGHACGNLKFCGKHIFSLYIEHRQVSK
jgi:hypothetical protein